MQIRQLWSERSHKIGEAKETEALAAFSGGGRFLRAEEALSDSCPLSSPWLVAGVFDNRFKPACPPRRLQEEIDAFETRKRERAEGAEAQHQVPPTPDTRPHPLSPDSPPPP